MDESRLMNACQGKAAAAGGMNMPEILQLARSAAPQRVSADGKGPDGKKLLREELLALVCAKYGVKSAKKKATASAASPQAPPQDQMVAPMRPISVPGGKPVLREENPFIAHMKATKGLTKQQQLASYRSAKAAGTLPEPKQVVGMSRDTLVGALHSCAGLEQDPCTVAPNCFWQPKAKRCVTRSGKDVVDLMGNPRRAAMLNQVVEKSRNVLRSERQKRNAMLNQVVQRRHDQLVEKINHTPLNEQERDFLGMSPQVDQQGGYWW